MGLIQRAIEAAGITTVSVSLQRDITRKVKPPRAVFLRYPFGHPMGEAFAVKQQRAILLEGLRALEREQRPGSIVEPGYAWRRHTFD